MLALDVQRPPSLWAAAALTNLSWSLADQDFELGSTVRLTQTVNAPSNSLAGDSIWIVGNGG